MVIDSMSRRTRSLRRGLPAAIRSPLGSLLIATLLSAVGSVAIAGNAQTTEKLKLDERVVTAGLATALTSTPTQQIMPTIIIQEYMPTIVIDE